jgi:hypothetical protein
VFVGPPIPDEYSYSHLLGLYLGDGCINRRTFQLVFHFDAKYPGLIDDAETSIRLVALEKRVHRRRREGFNVGILECAWVRWADYFPQMGPGRKHERAIALEPWQAEIVDREPEAFLRGLVESDGCRVINRFETTLPSGRVAEYAYARYFFSNMSADIRGLFCMACERIGVRWTQSNARNISVAHRDSVALLDTFIGPKA